MDTTLANEKQTTHQLAGNTQNTRAKALEKNRDITRTESNSRSKKKSRDYRYPRRPRNEKGDEVRYRVETA